MYKKIIVTLALDHGYGKQAIETALKLKAEGGEIIAIHISEPVQESFSAYATEDYVDHAYHSAMSQLKGRLLDHSDIEAVVLSGRVGQTIVEYAKEIGADLIVMGSHKPGLVDYFLGSTASRVVRHAPCSVHVLRRP